MLDLAFEVIGQAASNSLLVFCFCNLIIVMILMGWKPALSVAQELDFSPSDGYIMHKNAKEETNFTPWCRENDQLLIDVAEICNENEETVEDNKESGDNNDADTRAEDKEEDEDRDEDKDEDDELRRRVEEFIAKVNKEWKDERLRALNLAYD